MRTDRQKKASRLNGARSQGPKTAEGKTRSARNAITHGLTAEVIVLDCEDPSEFEAILAEHVELLRPRNRIELTLVERMVTSWWRSRRALSIETNRLDLHMNHQRQFNDQGLSEPQLLSRAYGSATSEPGAVPSVERHIHRINREYDRALQLLLKLQQQPDLKPPVESVQNEPELEQAPLNQEPARATQARVIPFPSPAPDAGPLAGANAGPERHRPPAA